MNALITDEEKRFFKDEGYLVLRERHGLAYLESIRQTYHKVWLNLLEQGKIIVQSDRPLEVLFPPLRGEHETNEDVKRCLINEINYRLAQQLLEDEPLAVGCTYFFKPPTARGIPFHQDNYDIGAYPPKVVGVWVSVDASGPDNGGLLMVPRTHKLGLLPPRLPGDRRAYGQSVRIPEGYKTVSLQTLPGDVVLFDGFTLHGSGPNRTDHHFRQAFVTHFVGEKTESVFVQHQSLVNSEGKLVSRKLNRRHSIDQMFLS
ncbi:phytanoyl-CoA dioxygenase family protein [Paenibacillus kobensis]|uniref:phytanoyl-CoA dioxygenase family protein n=1 Tax=Paenibacillus kobensis TaxID=59841 RepID=UPI000FD9DF7F|nr:phytanoyl-CoA dioxygenase family protein [Paenibacillus kobensis]